MKNEECAVVSGAASGLGKSITTELIKQGLNVIAIGRGEEQLKLLETDIDSPKLSTYLCDVGEYEQVLSTVNKINQKFSVKYLFNVAGSPAFSHISDIDDMLLDEALSGSLKGVVYLSSLLLKEIQKTTGSILTVLSSTALTGRPEEAAYAASKWGARGFMECLKAECKGTGTRVISAFPGGIKTPFWDKEEFLTPNIESFMEPDDIAIQLVQASRGIGSNGYVSSIIIERD